MLGLIELGDGVQGLLSLQSGSAALVLSDLPSGETRADFDVAPDLNALWPAIWHALRPDGVAVLMASSLRFAARLLASQQQHFRHDLIWSKSLATGHLNAARCPLRAHEFILIFSRQVGTYHPQMLQGASPIHAARRRSYSENYGPQRVTESRVGATDRYPTSVLEFSSVGTNSKARRHPQQKPEPLLRWLIRTYSDAGDLVVDPYAGSGSTGAAAFCRGPKFSRVGFHHHVSVYNQHKNRGTCREVQHREGNRLRCKNWYAANREQACKKERERRAENREHNRAYQRLRTTGRSAAGFAITWAMQQGRCAICQTKMLETGKGKNAVTSDHCHKTGQPRGLICSA